MKLSILLGTAIWATSIVAVPRGSGLSRRIASRTTRQGAPIDRASGTLAVEADNSSNVEYSSNWSGAVLTAPPPGETFSSVVGTFNVPEPKTPAGATSGTYSASIWAGIDGDTYQNAILQAGVDVTVTKSGSKSTLSYDSWYEWFPNYAITIPATQFSFKANDIITVSITSTTSSKGSITLTNNSTKKSYTQAVTAPSTDAVLGGQNAEWIVEDYQQNNALVPFANFGVVNFTSCVAKSATKSLGTTNAAIINLKSGQTIHTDVTIPSDTQVNVQYL
jgi:hypothetical protein